MWPARVKNRLVGLMTPVALNWTVRALSPCVHIRVRHDHRHPELSLRIDRRRADHRRHERHFAIFDTPRRPLRRLCGQEIVDLAPFDVTLEQQLAVRVVLPEHRLSGEEDIEEAAGRIDQRQPRVECQVQIALLVTGVA